MRKNEEDAVIYPLFSSPVYLRKIKVDLEKIFSLINNDFVKSGDKTTASVSNITKASSDKLVLNKSKWKFLKKIIDNEVNLYTSNILKFKNKFKLTTSWFTKSEPGEESNFHNHQNSMLSAVLYLRSEKNSGSITFHNFLDQNLFFLKAKEWTIYNSRAWTFEPLSGEILIFPSYLFHKVCRNESKITRYSLACNYMPVGDILDKTTDNYLHIK